VSAPPAPPLVLASTSSQRRAILEQLRIPFEVVTPDYVEDDPPQADAVELVRVHVRGPLTDSNRRPAHHEREEGVDSCGNDLPVRVFGASQVAAGRRVLQRRATLVRPCPAAVI
jgi:hypothetical protein